MYNEKMSKEECESESYSTCFLGVSASHHASHNMCHTSLWWQMHAMSGNLFLCFLLVNKNTKSLICILFTVAHVSKLQRPTLLWRQCTQSITSEVLPKCFRSASEVLVSTVVEFQQFHWPIRRRFGSSGFWDYSLRMISTVERRPFFFLLFRDEDREGEEGGERKMRITRMITTNRTRTVEQRVPPERYSPSRDNNLPDRTCVVRHDLRSFCNSSRIALR